MNGAPSCTINGGSLAAQAAAASLAGGRGGRGTVRKGRGRGIMALNIFTGRTARTA
jgi:hypothetical protein